jgi:arsenate reductase
MSDQLNVLIICRHNSGRSQIAEAYLKKRTGGRVQVDSAGLEPAAAVNPLVVEVMQEEGFDMISFLRPGFWDKDDAPLQHPFFSIF